MAIRITLRKCDLDIIEVVDDAVTNTLLVPEELSSKQLKAWSSFNERVLAAINKPKRQRAGVLSVADAIEVFRGVLGRRLVVPAGQPGPEWYAPLQKRLYASGLTALLAKKAAEVAAAQWKGSIKAESLIRQADTLLSDSNMDSIEADLPPSATDMEDL